MDKALNDIMDDFNEKIDDVAMNDIEENGYAYMVTDKDGGTKFRVEDPQEIELPKDEYAVLAHKRGKVNYEYTAENFYLFRYNKYIYWNVYQKIPIDGNNE